jgi:hypothetical protein
MERPTKRSETKKSEVRFLGRVDFFTQHSQIRALTVKNSHKRLI